jgi:hypothetical protein
MLNALNPYQRLLALGMLAALLVLLSGLAMRGQAGSAAASPGRDRADDVGDYRVALPLLLRGAVLADLPPPVVVDATATRVPSTSTPTSVPPTVTHTPQATEAPTLTATSTEPPSSPTPEVTVTPEATPTEPPKPTPASECRELAVNGNFEEGANGWDLYTNTGAVNDRLARVITQPADNRLVQPHGGSWVAQMGGFTGRDDIVDELTNPDPANASGWTLPTAVEIVSATLKFYYTVESQEPRNRVDDDRFTMALINGEKSQRIEILPSPLSEESTEAGTWRMYRFDITQKLTQRRDWDRARIVMKSENGTNLATWHFVDDLSVTLCTKAQ